MKQRRGRRVRGQGEEDVEPQNQQVAAANIPVSLPLSFWYSAKAFMTSFVNTTYGIVELWETVRCGRRNKTRRQICFPVEKPRMYHSIANTPKAWVRAS